MKKEIEYIFLHLGIPSSQQIEKGNYSSNFKMHTKDNNGNFRIQWHFFERDSPLNPLIKELPHVAFKVKNLQEAIEGEGVILGFYEPISDKEVPIELTSTNLNDKEL